MIWSIGIIGFSEKAEKIHLIFSPQSFETEHILKLSTGSLRAIIDGDEQVRILDMILERVYDSTKVWFFHSYLTQGVASTVAIFRPICHNTGPGVDLIKTKRRLIGIGLS